MIVPGDFFAQFLAFDARLATKGFPPLSRFWSRALAKFFRSACRRLVVRCGRRGGKSLTMQKVATFVARYGAWSVPPGELGVIPFVSVDRPEAAARIRGCAAMFDAEGVRYVRRGDEIELLDRPCVLRVTTCTTSAVVGFTSVLIICDEVAKWRDTETGKNPAKEVVASLSPTMATQASARLFVVSSAWSTVDYHCQLFELGDDGFQQVAFAETWVAHPSLTERETRALEPDERVWLREYAARPSDAIASICSAAEYDACTSNATERPAIIGGRYSHFTDVGLRNDNWVTMTAHHQLRDHGGDSVVDVVVIDRVTVLKPSFLRRLTLDDGLKVIMRHVTEYGGGSVYGDVYYADSLRPELLKRGVKFVEVSNASQAISERVANLQMRFASQTIDLVRNDEMRKEVLGAVFQMHPNNRQTLRAPERKGLHDDCVSVTLLAVDPETTIKLPPTEGEIVVRREPIHWSPEHGGLQGGRARYYRRLPNGALETREPPYGTRQFEEWAKGMISMGDSTPSVQRWQREQQQQERSRDGRAVNTNVNPG
jgi:hypothetical protein